MDCGILRIGVWLCVLCLTCAACQKVELPPEEGGEGGDAPAAEAGYDDALTVGAALLAYEGIKDGERFGQGVAGYIVGSCTGTSLSTALFGAEGAGQSNILIADTPTETDAHRCMPVELKSGTEERAALNLSDHPENIGQRVYLFGLVTKYFGVTGLKDVDYYRWMTPDEEPLPPDEPDDSEEPDESDEPDEPEPGDGYGDVLTVNEVLAVYEGIGSEDSYEEKVVGYIVGSCTGTSLSTALFGAEGASRSNILIADTPAETDVDRCMPVELKNGTAERAALNLSDHPENIGQRVYLLGLVEKYFGVTGLKGVDYYEWAQPEEEPLPPDNPDEPDEPDNPDEGEEDPDTPVVPDDPDEPTPEPGDGTDGRDTITVDDTPAVVPGGRSI